ncbi:MAG: metallophosphoesterase family protein [Lactobacillales bacterium]|jgi:predicted phosphodiesterase|nr:metallophosphoesterase family protein [Lactobacillales bacterium]
MKIVVIGDLHGNIFALDSIPKGDQLIIVGDFLTDFYQYTQEMIERIKKLQAEGAIIVSGNREREILAQHRGELGTLYNDYKQFGSNLKTYERLSEEDLKWISEIPDKVDIELDGNRFFVTHGDLKFDIDPDVDYVLNGHAHNRNLVEDENGTVNVRPGTAGGIATGKDILKPGEASYAIIDSDGEVEVEFKIANYDFGQLEPDGSLWLDLTIASMTENINYVNKVLYHMIDKCAEDDEAIPNVIWEQYENGNWRKEIEK